MHPADVRINSPARAFRRVCVAAVCAVVLDACSSRVDVRPLGSRTMPDPRGCYVLVYELPDFMGAREFINGPRSYPSLISLPFRENWRRRIRSAQVGGAASVVLWAEVGFRGASQRLAPGNSYRTLTEGIMGRVEALEIACAQDTTSNAP
jgi:hypothetical protein